MCFMFVLSFFPFCLFSLSLLLSGFLYLFLFSISLYQFISLLFISLYVSFICFFSFLFFSWPACPAFSLHFKHLNFFTFPPTSGHKHCFDMKGTFFLLSQPSDNRIKPFCHSLRYVHHFCCSSSHPLTK